MLRDCQNLLFSTAFPQKVKHFTKGFAFSANEIHLGAEKLTVEGIKQFYMDCKDDQYQYNMLLRLYYLLTIEKA
jgi:ATP-dependent RNA helicase DDX19/DBP5